MIKIVAAAAAAVVLLAGCSSGKPTKPVGSTSGRPSAATPGPTVTYASVAQWGSFIATVQTPVLQAHASMAGCQLAVVDPACGLPALTFEFTVQTFVIKLSEEIKPAELGTPPPELSALVGQTLAAAKAVNDASVPQQRCLSSTTTACIQTDLAWDQAHDALIATLNGWKSYTGG